jgi:type IX secretion system PorP/SprF family membrane protein
MDLKSISDRLIKLLLVIAVVLPSLEASAQQTPLNPLSYWVFTPYLYNPAMVGSKEFMTLDANVAGQGKSNAQILSMNTRLSKTKPGYFSAPKMKEFKSFGVGGSVFNDVNGSSHNIGISAAGSYQIPINTKDLSFFSAGVAVKGIYNMLDTSETEAGNPSMKTFYPNVDAGLYYYGPNLFSGISVVNALGSQGKKDSLGKYMIPVGREYYFTLGYKFVLSKTSNIVLEPSVLISATDTTLSDIPDNIRPILKLYFEEFCIGTYFLGDKHATFFFEYRFPKLYLGAFFELPKKTAYYKSPLLAELTIGFNFQVDKSRLSRRSIW